MTLHSPEKRKRGRPRNPLAKIPDNTVQALDRGLVVLQYLQREQSATLGALAKGVDMSPSTVHRILATLQNHLFVDFESQTQEWAIGIGAFRVGSAFLSRSNLIEASQKIMRDLMQKTGETANLGLAEAGNIVFIAQVESPNPIRAMFRQGTGSPMHASGIGKAILAEMSSEDVEKRMGLYGQPAFTPHTLITLPALSDDLDDAKTRGWALDNEERYIGMCCVAAAVYNGRGNAVAGLSVSGPTARFGKAEIARIGAVVRDAALTLTDAIGGRK